MHLVENNHLFSSYYLAFQKELTFSACVDITPDSFKYGEAFIQNSANRVVGFSAKISNGILVFLPQFNFSDENDKKFVGILLQIAKKHFGTEVKSLPPDWTGTFVIPGVDLLAEKIRGVERKILEFESQKSEIEIKRDNLDDYKSLLYEQGRPLERKVLDTLRLMGFKADTVPGPNTDFDVILESEEGRAIAEVEGKDDNAIHKDKTDQLISAINQDVEQRDVFAKGVFIGNHYRLKPLEQREGPFTKTVINLAKQYRYALITTADLYLVVGYLLQHPEDEVTKKACRSVIFGANGELVKFPLP